MSSFWKFCIVGAINTLVDVSIFTALHAGLGWGVLASNIVSTSLALGLSYILNRRYTFPTDKVSHKRTALYFAVTLTGLWILAPLTIKALMNLDWHIHYTQPFITLLGHEEALQAAIPKLISVVVTMAWNYVWYSRVVFAKPAPLKTGRD